MGREREKQVEKIQSTESQYQQHITKLQRQLQAVEKERNMCMVSVFLQRNADRAGLVGCIAHPSVRIRIQIDIVYCLWEHNSGQAQTNNGLFTLNEGETFPCSLLLFSVSSRLKTM